jgi:hypothetical protein
MGDNAPSQYLGRIRREPPVCLDGVEMNMLLPNQLPSPEPLRQGAFHAFGEDRRMRSSRLVEGVMGNL